MFENSPELPEINIINNFYFHIYLTYRHYNSSEQEHNYISVYVDIFDQLVVHLMIYEIGKTASELYLQKRTMNSWMLVEVWLICSPEILAVSECYTEVVASIYFIGYFLKIPSLRIFIVVRCEQDVLN